MVSLLLASGTAFAVDVRTFLWLLLSSLFSLYSFLENEYFGSFYEFLSFCAVLESPPWPCLPPPHSRPGIYVFSPAPSACDDIYLNSNPTCSLSIPTGSLRSCLADGAIAQAPTLETREPCEVLVAPRCLMNRPPGPAILYLLYFFQVFSLHSFSTAAALLQSHRCHLQSLQPRAPQYFYCGPRWQPGEAKSLLLTVNSGISTTIVMGNGEMCDYFLFFHSIFPFKKIRDFCWACCLHL